jgi:hypothetical protein
MQAVHDRVDGGGSGGGGGGAGGAAMASDVRAWSGWWRFTDAATGEHYFYHAQLGTQWDDPQDFWMDGDAAYSSGHAVSIHALAVVEGGDVGGGDALASAASPSEAEVLTAASAIAAVAASLDERSLSPASKSVYLHVARCLRASLTRCRAGCRCLQGLCHAHRLRVHTAVRPSPSCRMPPRRVGTLLCTSRRVCAAGDGRCRRPPTRRTSQTRPATCPATLA